MNNKYHSEKMDKARPCSQCGKLTHNAEIWYHSGIVIPLCSQDCYDKYWTESSARCNS